MITLTKSEFRERFNKCLAGIGNDFTNALVERCPVDSGALRNSIKYKVKGKAIIISMLGYAVYVEYGTPPHIIRAKNAQALHWKNSNKDVFVKEVHHPGTQPYPFIRTAVAADLPKIIKSNMRRQFT